MATAGLWLFPGPSIAALVDAAELGESLAYDNVWISDFGFYGHDVYMSLALMGRATRRIRLGPALVNPYTRHPAVHAVAIATLYELTGGRACLTYGIGGESVLYPLGLRWNRPVQAGREAVEITRALLAGNAVTYPGGVFSVSGAKLRGTYADVPIYFGARSPKLLRMAGAVADGVLLSGSVKYALGRDIGYIREGAAETGNRPKIAYVAWVAPDRKTFDDMRAEFTFSVMKLDDEGRERLGVTRDLAQAIGEKVIREGSYAAAPLVTDDVLEGFVIHGDRQHCAAEVADLVARHRIDQVVVPVRSYEAAADTLEQFRAMVPA